jgi:hypothetical protein
LVDLVFYAMLYISKNNFVCPQRQFLICCQ